MLVLVEQVEHWGSLRGCCELRASLLLVGVVGLRRSRELQAFGHEVVFEIVDGLRLVTIQSAQRQIEANVDFQNLELLHHQLVEVSH